MKFAIIENVKTEAFKGAIGNCPNCGSELIAKCGEFKVNHWAHKSVRSCDPWWKNETAWHRAWKGNFSLDWQEVILADETTNERHIADIRTPYGLVIEFQHSHIDPIERTKREKFYKRMVWVVDGTRLKKDYPRFLKAKDNFRSTSKQGMFLVDDIESCFPAGWVGSSVPVIFDFKGLEEIDHERDLRNHLYYLYPKTQTGEFIVALMSRQALIQSIADGNFLREHKESDKNIPIQVNYISTMPRTSSQYVIDRGRFVKRRRL